MRKENFTVSGMSCSACSARIENEIRKLEGVGEAGVNLLTGTMTVSFDEKLTDADYIIKKTVELGYQAAIKNPVKETRPKPVGKAAGTETDSLKSG